MPATQPAAQLLNHVAMSVPHASLAEAPRRALVEFSADVFGWTEIRGLARPDRLTLSIEVMCFEEA